MPYLATQPFLSIGQLCDAGCNITFTANQIIISHNQAIIMTRHCTATSKLWELDICPPVHDAHTAIGSTTPGQTSDIFPCHIVQPYTLHNGNHPTAWPPTQICQHDPQATSTTSPSVHHHDQRPNGSNLTKPTIHNDHSDCRCRQPVQTMPTGARRWGPHAPLLHSIYGTHQPNLLGSNQVVCGTIQFRE